MAKKISLGTLYIDGKKILSPTKPWVASATSAYKHPVLGAGNIEGKASISRLEVKETDSNESYVIKWVDVNEDGSFLIADRCLYRCSYNFVNNSTELQEGKLISLDNKIYSLKFITEEEHHNYIANDLNLPNLPLASDLDKQVDFDGSKYDTEANSVWNYVGIGYIFKSLRRSSSSQINDIFDKPSDVSASTLNTNTALRLTLTLVSDYTQIDMPTKLDYGVDLTKIVNTTNSLYASLESYKNNLFNNLVLKNKDVRFDDNFSTLIDKTGDIHGIKFVDYETDLELSFAKSFAPYSGGQLSSTTEALRFTLEAVQISGTYNINVEGSNQGSYPGYVYIYVNDKLFETFQFTVTGSYEFETVTYQKYLEVGDVVKIKYKTRSNSYECLMYLESAGLSMYAEQF